MQKSKIFKNFAIYDSLYKPLKESEVDTRAELRGDYWPSSSKNRNPSLCNSHSIVVDTPDETFLICEIGKFIQTGGYSADEFEKLLAILPCE